MSWHGIDDVIFGVFSIVKTSDKITGFFLSVLKDYVMDIYHELLLCNRFTHI